MKKKSVIGLLVGIVLLTAILPLGGCEKADDKINDENGKGIKERYLEGVTDGKADLEIEDGKWPSDIPAKVPRFKAGKIDGSSSITVAGTTQLSIAINDVREKDYKSYTGELVSSGFVEMTATESGGILSGSYKSGDIYMTLSLDTSSGEMLISYTGNK